MDLIRSIRQTLVPIHRAGYPFIAIFLVVSILIGLIWLPLFWIGLLLTIWCVYFFRDPRRATPLDPDLVISPADGKVSAVTTVVPPLEMGMGNAPMTRISVFMNVFNCHVNRMPISGRIKRVAYTKGRFLNADLDKASTENERNALVVETEHGLVGCVQIAGLVARRIICWTRVDDDMEVGERFGLIRFGSRLDVFLPAGAEPRVSVGQTAVAGETVIAEFRSSKGPTVGRVG